VNLDFVKIYSNLPKFLCQASPVFLILTIPAAAAGQAADS